MSFFMESSKGFRSYEMLVGWSLSKIFKEIVFREFFKGLCTKEIGK